ncbi:MAG: ABC-ATPase domain-containing protein [Cyanobacteria bacterium P01_D01_bin.105]
MVDWRTLQQTLQNLEGSSYRNYKRIKGHYECFGFNDEFELLVDYVQGDPFASPSRIRIRLNSESAGFSPQLIAHYENQVAIADYLTRQVANVVLSLRKKRGSGNSGKIEIATPSQAILRRTAIRIDKREIEVRLTVGLPAFGRRIAGIAAAELLCEDIPQIIENSLTYRALEADALMQHIHTFQDAEALRRQLKPNRLVAFVADGACLPRRSGIDKRPLTEGVEPFIAPAAGAVELETPHSGKVRGLGVQAGVTLIVGGGYHGKSTLLRAIEQGIYSHVPGDGREQVVSIPSAVKLRAEDGRSVAGVDISPAINHLPQGRASDNFSTANASGSTSQAAGLVEAVEVGAEAILIDEDTAATNFMIRDCNMQALISKENEPITPFVDKVRQLYDDYGISTVLVMGGSGDYFAVADRVIAMENYRPQIVTQQAKVIARADPNQRNAEGGERFGSIRQRAMLSGSVPAGKRDRIPKIKSRMDALTLGQETIDLQAVEQLVEVHQVRAIGQAILYAQQYYCDGRRSLRQILELVMEDIERNGLDTLAIGLDTENPRISGDLAKFRQFELAAAINRLRTLRVNPIY